MTLPIPGSPSDITDEWLEQLLRRHHSDDYKLTATSQASITGNQLAVCSEMHCVNCLGRLGSRSLTDHLIAKLLPRDAQMKTLVTSLRMIQCETAVYMEMLPRLCEFERCRGRDVIAAMTSRCLHAAIADVDEGDGLRYVIVLENLQPAGFWTPDPRQLPEDVLPEAVRQLARLAATSNAWLRNCNLRDLPYLLRTRLPSDHPAAHFIRVGVQNVEPGLRRDNRLGLLDKLRRLQERGTELISRGLQPREETVRVISHGDFRDGNLLLRRGAGGDWQVRVVDWQATMMAHPAVDLIYLLMMSVPRAVMKQQEAAVLDTYFAEFAECARSLGVDCVLTRQALEAGFRRAKLLGLMWCLCMVSFWSRVPDWPDHCIDVAVEVEQLGLLDDL